jgi:16S rRNA (guanine527-N7)-methyltransferase
MTAASPAEAARRHTLEKGAQALGLSLPPGAIDCCLAYLSMLVKWNKVYNLTAIRDPDAMVVQHLLDSLAIVPLIEGQRLLDIGSGAGLPGIPVAIARPDLAVTVLDSNQKKCAFMQQAVSELHLPNVTVRCTRIEDLPAAPTPTGQALTFDTITSRAFAELIDFVTAALPLLAREGLLLAMKGVHPIDEMTRLPDTVRVRDTQPLTVPGLDAARCAIRMERTPK